jgi:hypothetical protein
MLRSIAYLAAGILSTAALAACSGAVSEGDGGASTSGAGGGDTTGGNATGGESTGDPTGGNPTGGNPTGGNPTGGNPTGGNPTGGNTSAAALANTRAEMDVLWEQYWEDHPSDTGSTGSGGNDDDLDPNDLFLRISDVGVTCSSPTVELPCGSHWKATLVLPPALQQVGVYDLGSPEVMQYSSMSETGPVDGGPEDCWWGGGTFAGGTLEITAIDATHVDFVLNALAPNSNPSGTYSAQRCP